MEYDHQGTAFLEGQTLSKIKKLINLIRTNSESPEAEQVFKDYLGAWLQKYESEQKLHANAYVNFKDESKRHEEEVHRLMKIRDRFKCKSEQYEHFNELVKKERAEWNQARGSASSHLSHFNSNETTKKKYEKILEYINQG